MTNIGSSDLLELALLRASHDVVLVTDRAGRALLISPSIEAVLGYRVDELVGQRLFDWIHAEDQTDVRASAKALLEGEASIGVDARVLSSSGDWVPMRWSLYTGPTRRFYAVGRDLTRLARDRKAVLLHEMAELRLRTAMELHDGVLQTLTGASLQIAVARRILRTDQGAAEEILEHLGHLVSAEQQELRLYVDEVKGPPPPWTDSTLRLPQRIRALLDRVGVMWGVRTVVETKLGEDIGAEPARRILRIIQEATVNAARHGGAKTVSVTVANDGSDVSITVVDDGRGFAFLGDFDHDALKEKRLGPLSLKHRVEEAGGRLAICSRETGSTLSVRLPAQLEGGTE